MPFAAFSWQDPPPLSKGLRRAIGTTPQLAQKLIFCNSDLDKSITICKMGLKDSPKTFLDLENQYTSTKYTSMRCTPIRYTPVRCTFIRYTPIRCAPVSYTPSGRL